MYRTRDANTIIYYTSTQAQENCTFVNARIMQAHRQSLYACSKLANILNERIHACVEAVHKGM